MHKTTRYQFSTPEEIFDLSRKVAAYFPTPSDIMTGVYELLLNAVEHGNLGMDRSLKAQLLLQGKFNEEMARKLALPENREKYVTVEISENTLFSSLTITDHGEGFNWRHRMNTPPEDASIHGRGLLIAMRCGFDGLNFNEKGNSVSCVSKNYDVQVIRHRHEFAPQRDFQGLIALGMSQ